MRIYHYTKCIKLNSIFEDGFIATEMQRTLNDDFKFTNNVWLTEKCSYPKTALPLLPEFKETNLMTHLQCKGTHVDLDKIGAYFGKFYRFSFESSDARFRKWFMSEERHKLKNNQYWMQMEKVANKVGDDVRSFWFSNNQIDLENFNLEVFEGSWKVLLVNASLSMPDSEVLDTIQIIKNESIAKCKQLGIKYSSLNFLKRLIKKGI